MSTLANVVTTLATMGKKDKDSTTSSSGRPNSTGNPTANGEVQVDGGSDIAKAFDTLAKVIQPDNSLNSSQNDSALDSSLDQTSNDGDPEEAVVIDFEGVKHVCFST